MNKYKIIFTISILLFLFSTINNIVAQTKTTHIIAPSTYIIDGEELNASPGDTILLQSSAKPYLLIRNIHGSSLFPITIKNYNGIIIIDTDHFYGISIQHSEHVIISGMDDYGYDYGIQILRVANGAGIGITDYSTNVEIKGIEIANTMISGIVSKTDPICDENNEIHPTRDDFVQYNIIIHDNYLHDIGNEGMYIGSSFFTGYTLECNGQSHTVLPHVNSGVQIYNNKLERTGWDGIQVSSTINNCNIYSNEISHDSEAEYHNQMSGIIIGGGSKADCYNNIIKDGKGDGIEVFGQGNQKIYNNLIIRAGRSYHSGDQSFPKHGIYCGDVYTQQNAFMYFYHNTIISPKTDGIKFNNDETIDNRAYNNIIVDPGSYDIVGEDSYIHLGSENITIDKQNNYLGRNIYAVKFGSPANDNYDLQVNSPLINEGKYIPEISFDIAMRPRKISTSPDIGAYECNKQGVDIEEISPIVDKIFSYPNPCSHETTLYARSKQQTQAYLVIKSILGNLLDYRTLNIKKGKNEFIINLEKYPSGIYLYNIKYLNGNKSGKIIKQ